MKITIETIPHDRQRYNTVGDYVKYEDGSIAIFVSDLGNPVYEQAVILHELFELFMVLNRGIRVEDIDAFDIAFEAGRQPGNIDEPGDDPAAPYRNEHCFATACERMFIAAMGATWKDYDQACQDA
jgi:hypothetical protein